MQDRKLSRRNFQVFKSLYSWDENSIHYRDVTQQSLGLDTTQERTQNSTYVRKNIVEKLFFPEKGNDEIVEQRYYLHSTFFHVR